MASVVECGQLAQTGRCYFLEIAPELRLRIYDFVFVEKMTIHLKKYTTDFIKVQRLPSNSANPSALLQTCRAIYTEAKPEFYKHVDLMVDISPCYFFRKPRSKKEASYSKELRMTYAEGIYHWLRRYLAPIQRVHIQVQVFGGLGIASVVEQIEAVDEAIHDSIDKTNAEHDNEMSFNCTLHVSGDFNADEMEVVAAFKSICRKKVKILEAEQSRSAVRLLLWSTLCDQAVGDPEKRPQ